MSVTLNVVTAVGILAELVAASRRALRESSLALLSPMMISSELETLSGRLDRLMLMGDRERAAEELERFGVSLRGPGQPLKQIESAENYLLQRFDDRYNELIHYMPENLSAFFRLWRQTWDAENLKILFRCIVKSVPYELRRSSIGPTGNIGKETLYSLAMSRRPREYIARVFSLLSREMVLSIGAVEEPDVDAFDVALDRAYAGYLAARVGELRLKDPEAAWRAIAGEYEYRDIINMARLKKAGLGEAIIRSNLVLHRSILTESQYEALIKARDYENFYHVLLTTEYSEALPQKTVLEPPQLSESLQNLRLSRYLRSLRVDEEEDFIIRSMIGVHHSLDAIRRRAIYPLEATP
ncbi:MAG: V-type ATPase subunit [Candidatus Bathyarchaeota archaeon]